MSNYVVQIGSGVMKRWLTTEYVDMVDVVPSILDGALVMRREGQIIAVFSPGAWRALVRSDPVDAAPS